MNEFTQSLAATILFLVVIVLSIDEYQKNEYKFELDKESIKATTLVKCKP